MATATPLKPRLVPKHIGCHHNPKHKPVVDQDPTFVSIQLQESVEWGNKDKTKAGTAMMTMVDANGKLVSANVRFIIRFDKPEGSPFTASFFCVPDVGTVPSGTLKPGVKAGEKYHYTIQDMEGNTTDPEIDIMP